MYVVILCYVLLLLVYGLGLTAALRGLEVTEPKKMIVKPRRQRKLKGGIDQQSAKLALRKFE